MKVQVYVFEKSLHDYFLNSSESLFVICKIRNKPDLLQFRIHLTHKITSFVLFDIHPNNYTANSCFSICEL